MPATRVGEPSALAVRVDTLADDVHAFNIKMETMQSRMATKEDLQGIISSINALTIEQKNIGRPNWQAMGVTVTVLTLIGGILYWPIRESTNDMKLVVIKQDEISTITRVDIGVLKESSRSLDRRLDAISQRLAELIGTGK